LKCSKGAIVLGDWEEVQLTVDRLPMKNNEIGIIGRQTLGATRLQEKADNLACSSMMACASASAIAFALASASALILASESALA
jgi:hypothetical protein